MLKSSLSLHADCKVTFKTSNKDVWENLAFTVSEIVWDTIC